MFGSLILLGCFSAPVGTEPISEHPNLVEIAEWMADYVNAPESCRNWDQVGVYRASSPTEYYQVTGRCATDQYGHLAPVVINGVDVCTDASKAAGWGIIFFYVENNTWDDVIVFPGFPLKTVSAAHEVLHHLIACMHGGDPLADGNSNHGNPLFNEILILLDRDIERTNETYGTEFTRYMDEI